MKKWLEGEIDWVGHMEVSGPQVVDFFQQLMKNQNEVMEFFEFLDEISGQPFFENWQKVHDK